MTDPAKAKAEAAFAKKAAKESEANAAWLLQSRDAIEFNEINLTQEFLSHILGVQRAAVSIAAIALQDAQASDFPKVCVKRRRRTRKK